MLQPPGFLHWLDWQTDWTETIKRSMEQWINGSMDLWINGVHSCTTRLIRAPSHITLQIWDHHNACVQRKDPLPACINFPCANFPCVIFPCELSASIKKELEDLMLIWNTCEAITTETLKSFAFCTGGAGFIEVQTKTLILATVRIPTFINVNLTVFACSPLITATVVWPRKINARSTVARLTWQNMPHCYWYQVQVLHHFNQK